jgi:hypothetical protein
VFGVNMFKAENDYGNHAMVEVHYADAWHLFDCTWGVYFRDPVKGNILSASDLLRNPDCGIAYGDEAIVREMRNIFRNHVAVVLGEQERRQFEQFLR